MPDRSAPACATRNLRRANRAVGDYDNDLNANGREDGAEYDRTVSLDPTNKPWQTRAPNGAVSLQDVQIVLAWVGHSCIAAP